MPQERPFARRRANRRRRGFGEDSAGRGRAKQREGQPLAVGLLSLVGALVFLAVYEIQASDRSSVDKLFTLAWLNNFALSAQIILLRRAYASFLSPVVLYSLFLSLFTSGRLVLLSLGIEPPGADIVMREATHSTVRAAAFYLCAFSSYCIGAALVNVLPYAARQGGRVKVSAEEWRRSLASVGALCATVGFLPFAVANFNNFRVVLTGGYSEYYQPGARLDSPILALGYLFVTGVIFWGCSGGLRRQRTAAIAMTVIGLLRLAIGDRGEGMIYLLTALILTRQLRSGRASWVAPGLVAGFAVFAIPAIGLLRQSFGSGNVSLQEAFLAQNPLVTTLETLGGTIYPLIKVMELVPLDTEFTLGASYLSGLLRIVPTRLLPGWLGEVSTDPLTASPASWLMQRLGLSYGQGFTPFSEAYMNFGWFGGCIFLLIFGLAIGALMRLPGGSESSRLRVAFVVAFFALCGFSVRGSFNFVLPYLLRYVLVPCLLVVIFAHAIHGRERRRA